MIYRIILLLFLLPNWVWSQQIERFTFFPAAGTITGKDIIADYIFDDYISGVTVTENAELYVGFLFPRTQRSTSIKTLDNRLIKIFPNPFENYLFVQAEDITITRFEIYDLHGRLLVRLFPKDNNFSIPSHLIPPGIIFIRVFASNNQLFIHHLIKKY